jgi:hypothetical protein
MSHSNSEDANFLPLQDENGSFSDEIGSDENQFLALEKTVEKTVYSLTKWVNALEDKVADLSEALKVSIETQSETKDVLKKLSESMDVFVKENERSRKRQSRLRISNYELGMALSGKLFKSEAKRAKIEFVQRDSIHPSVLPFIVSESESE